MSTSHAANAASNRWRLPLLQGIVPVDKSRLPADIMAGVTLAALGIPEVMGYTKIIGTPVITGLYTMLLPMIVFALLGSSRHLVVSADSATAAIVSAALTGMSIPAGEKYVAMTSLVALVAAAMLLLARILRMGFLADFLSRTVLVGFLSGVGVHVAGNEVKGMLGIERGGHGFWSQLAYTVQHLPQTDIRYLCISLIVLAVIIGFERFMPRFPGALVAVIGMIAASAAFHWGSREISLVGEVPGGLPQIGLPDVSWKEIMPVLPVSFSCFVVILAQSAATSRAYAMRYREEFSENVDLVGLSLANVAAGCSGTFVVNGSPTKTAMVDTAGGRSQISHLATAAMLLIVLLFLTGPLSYLPNAVLAAIVFHIGLKLIDIKGLKQIYRQKPREFTLAIVTAATVVIVGVEQGIMLALVLSLIQHVDRSYRPHAAIIVNDPVEHWRMEPIATEKMIEPGLVMYWFGSELFYANASRFSECAHKLVTESPSRVRWLAVDASAITAIDFSAGAMLRELQQDLAKQDVVLALTRVSTDLQKDLGDLGLTAAIGVHNIFVSRRDCLTAYQAAVAETEAGNRAAEAGSGSTSKQ
jgi:high affinity sulfate transporter 1